MKTIFVLLISIFIVYSISAQEKINKTFSFHHPESVAEYGDFYFVTDVGNKLEPMAVDGDGRIWKLKKDGEEADSMFVTGLNAPKGTAIIGSVLYVADIDKIKGFDVNTGDKKLEVDLSSTGAKFLNDLTVKDENTLYVSSTDLNKIYEISLSPAPGFSELKVDGDLTGPNGLFFVPSENKLYFNGYGKDGKPNGRIGYVDLNMEDHPVKYITDLEGYFDGLAVEGDILLTTDWAKSAILKITISSGKSETVNVDALKGPADFLLSGKDIIQPEMMIGNLYRF